MFLRYSYNNQAYIFYNLISSTMMQSINVVIDDSSVTKMEDFSIVTSLKIGVQMRMLWVMGSWYLVLILLNQQRLMKIKKERIFFRNEQRVLILLTTSFYILS